jgi:hypothetical protein
MYDLYSVRVIAVCSAYIGRKSSTMLLHIALSPAFTKPLEVVKVIGTVIDVVVRVSRQVTSTPINA